MKNILPGYIATYLIKDGAKMEIETNPLTVLNFYKDNDRTKGYKLTDKRNAELAQAIEWALNEIDPEVIQNQSEIEEIVPEQKEQKKNKSK